MARFIHPIHARGVQARRLSAHVSHQLTDKEIDKYIAAGHYGVERQREYLEQLAQKEKHVNNNTKRRVSKYTGPSLLDGIDT